jgi:hypothetical protein
MWIKLNVIHLAKDIRVNTDNIKTISFQDEDQVTIRFDADSDDEGSYKLSGMTEKEFIKIVNTKDNMSFEPKGSTNWDED